MEKLAIGRPLKPGRAPTAAKSSRLQEQQLHLDAHVAKDKLTQLAARGSGVELLWAACEAAARDAASIAFDRTLVSVHDRDFGRLASRHLDALREVARLRLAIDRVQPGSASPEVAKRVLDALREALLEIAAEALPAADAGRLAEVVRSRWDAWCDAALAQR